MIMHNCIKCDYFEMIPIAPITPCFQKYICPKCGEEQYIYHSRIEPKTYSKDSIVFVSGKIRILSNEKNQEKIGSDFDDFFKEEFLPEEQKKMLKEAQENAKEQFKDYKRVYINKE